MSTTSEQRIQFAAQFLTAIISKSDMTAETINRKSKAQMEEMAIAALRFADTLLKTSETHNTLMLASKFQ
jgi:hypothetical protein